MTRRPIVGLAGLGLVACAIAAAGAETENTTEPRPPLATAQSVLAGMDEPVRAVLTELLDRSPSVARVEYQAAAAAVRAPQARGLPQPMAQLTYFVMPPETRVGPQRYSVAVSQRIPWLGELDRSEQAAALEGVAATAEVEAERLRVLTEARTRLTELAFLAAREAIEQEELTHLARHEELARARYAAGGGLQQDVLRLQAEMTRQEGRLLELSARRTSVLAAFNALRDRPPSEPVGLPGPDSPGWSSWMPEPTGLDLAVDQLERSAMARPELAAVQAEIDRHGLLAEAAELSKRPDFQVGLAYTVVDPREDQAGIVNPPEGNGDDIFAISGGLSIPIWREQIDSRSEEILRRQSAVAATRRVVEAEITATVGDLAARLPLLAREHALYRDVLLVQAEEALQSAEAAYASGRGDALRLLDAEHVLFDVRLASARVRSDWATAVARLEGAIGRPLASWRTVP